jgi:hypothetical protein
MPSQIFELSDLPNKASLKTVAFRLGKPAWGSKPLMGRFFEANARQARQAIEIGLLAA